MMNPKLDPTLLQGPCESRHFHIDL